MCRLSWPGLCFAAGDCALGYDLANANLVNMDYEAHVNRGGTVPDVILVRKSYEEKRRRTRGRATRAWKLKHLPIEAGEDRCYYLHCTAALHRAAMLCCCVMCF